MLPGYQPSQNFGYLRIGTVYICTVQFPCPKVTCFYFSMLYFSRPTDFVALKVGGIRPPCEIMGGANIRGIVRGEG